MTRDRSVDVGVPDIINHEWRCEQFVEDEWIEVPMNEFTLISDPPFPWRLIRGGIEVGGKWRLWRDDELIATWTPVLP